MKQRWPKNLEFRKFAAQIADAVMWARSLGFYLEARALYREENDTACCPLGALKLKSSNGIDCSFFSCRFPDPRGSHKQAAFMRGFDSETTLAEHWKDKPYARLGAAYRALALKERGE